MLTQPFETAARAARHATLPCGRHNLLNIGGRDALTIQLLVQGEIPSAARKQPGKLFSHIITLPHFLLPLSYPHSSFLPLQATRPSSSHTKAVHQLEGRGRCSCCSGHLTSSDPATAKLVMLAKGNAHFRRPTVLSSRHIVFVDCGVAMVTILIKKKGSVFKFQISPPVLQQILHTSCTCPVPPTPLHPETP